MKKCKNKLCFFLSFFLNCILLFIHRLILYFNRPPPVVTDLDGDGLNGTVIKILLMESINQKKKIIIEIIILTREPDIQVYEFQELSNEKNGNLKLKFSSPLALETRVIKKRQPAAVGVGYFDLYKPNQPTRKQYIVILNQGWSILCYNHKLELLWERSIDFQIPKDYYIKFIFIFFLLFFFSFSNLYSIY